MIKYLFLLWTLITAVYLSLTLFSPDITGVYCSYDNHAYDYGQCVRNSKMWQVCCMDGWHQCDICSSVICC